ncbi:GPI inositol-deacylase [Klenkia terrae]|uniref:GPI inositol-deacylase n=2 Tax=Klenkia terrae TaxID=1052259 RepID=A0ABU8E8D8_9ACTN|nr:GPI inositol-deacylase [Klenkia terrae]
MLSIGEAFDTSTGVVVVPTVVFLHGVGDGDPSAGWFGHMNAGLEAVGYDAVDKGQTIAPRYSSILEMDGVSASVPARTYQPDDEDERRRLYERQQVSLGRLIGQDDRVEPGGLANVPALIVDLIHDAATLVDPGLMKQVTRYLKNEGVRGAILRNVLEQLPVEGSIVLVGHSLGSVVAIDLLDHLPAQVHVRRLITVGSPAGSPFLHEKTDRLLKRFPYGTVRDWANLYGRLDPITAGRGLGGTFPAAQDFPLAVGVSHGAEFYLQHSHVATLLGEAVFGSQSRELVPVERAIDLPESVPEQMAVFALSFAHHVRRNITDQAVARRYALALEIVQEEMSNRLRTMFAAEGRLATPAVLALTDGKAPRVQRDWELDQVIEPMVLSALSNLVQPYDIDPGKAPMAALRDMAIEVGIQPESGETIAACISEVRDALVKSSGIPWGRILIGAAGVALVAAGPLGVALAAPAGAFGAAAFTGALAAFGPGGMVGGMALLGTMTSAGSAAAAAAASAPSAADASLDQIVVDVLVKVSAARARQKLDLTPEEQVWFHVVALETEVAAERNRLTSLSDKKSLRIADLDKKLEVLRRLLSWMLENGLAPRMLDAEVVAP